VCSAAFRHCAWYTAKLMSSGSSLKSLASFRASVSVRLMYLPVQILLGRKRRLNMSKLRFLVVGVAATTVLLTCSSLAFAQCVTGPCVAVPSPQVFIASFSNGGSNANNCTTRATPCAAFGNDSLNGTGAFGALNKVKRGGSVFVLTPLVLP